MDSKFNTKAARVIAAQLYVAKGLKRNPAKMIKFIKCNREYFPNISSEMLVQIQKEHNLSNEEIDNHPDVQFADLQAESRFEKELLEKAEKLEKIRQQEKREQKRDHRGSGQSTVYKSRTEIEEEFEKILENMKKMTMEQEEP